MGSDKAPSLPPKSSLLTLYVEAQLGHGSFSTHEMCSSDERPDDYTLATVAKVSAEIGDSIAGKLSHGESLRIGFLSDMVVANSLMSIYCRCGQYMKNPEDCLMKCRKEIQVLGMY
ncbi:hypothetical protein I3843_02G064000 [Carya illinoinensis]|nr:hypothetical protein I3843_02G064000 [Carya illinoinensis]